MSTLSALAASMTPGSWAILNQDGDGSGWSRDLYDSEIPGGGVTSSGGIFSFMDKGVYEPTNNKVYVYGSAHDGQPETIIYDVASNTWTNTGVLSGSPAGHPYNSNTVDLTHRKMLSVARSANPNSALFNCDTNTWGAITNPVPAFTAGDFSTDYHQTRDELLWIRGWLGGMKMYNWGSDTWTTLYSGGASWNGSATDGDISAIEAYGAKSIYSTIGQCNVIIGGVNDLGGGVLHWSNAVYQYKTVAGVRTLKRMADTPFNLYTYTQYNLFTSDPASGDCILIQGGVTDPNGGPNFGFVTNVWTVYKYAPLTDTWTSLGTSYIPSPSTWLEQGIGVDQFAAIPISTYGVIMFASGPLNPGTLIGKVYLYKHAASAAPGPPGPGARRFCFVRQT